MIDSNPEGGVYSTHDHLVTKDKEANALTFQHFLNLPEEKRRQIFEAALDEFVTYGYDLASTNRIVERAGISKGVLFKYFSNKETLFHYICEQVMASLSEIAEVEPEELPSDFFEALKFFSWKEIEYAKQHPKLFALTLMMSNQPMHPVYQKELAQFQAWGLELYHKMLAAISTDDLRDDVPFERAYLLVQWVAEGFKKQFNAARTADHADLTPEQIEQLSHAAMQELDVYFELLKKGLYKRD